MEKSDNRILTTHVGSLPRVPALRELLKEREKSSQEISSELRDLIENAVSMAVDKHSVGKAPVPKALILKNILTTGNF